MWTIKKKHRIKTLQGKKISVRMSFESILKKVKGTPIKALPSDVGKFYQKD